MTTIQSHLRHGDFESAWRLAYLADSPNHDLIAALSLLCDAPTEEQVEEQLNAAAEDEYSRGYDDGKDDGRDEEAYDAATLAGRHLKALDPAMMALDMLRCHIPAAERPVFDWALAAIELTAEELDDYDEAIRKASRENR